MLKYLQVKCHHVYNIGEGGGEGKREGRVCKYGKLLMRGCTNICVILSILLYVKKFENTNLGASLVAQWLRVCLLMQGTRVRALVWEDPTCRGAAGPVGHNY